MHNTAQYITVLKCTSQYYTVLLSTAQYFMWFFSNFCLFFLVLDLEKEADRMEGESDQYMVLQVLLQGICSKQFKEVKQRYSKQCLGWVWVHNTSLYWTVMHNTALNFFLYKNHFIQTLGINRYLGIVS